MANQFLAKILSSIRSIFNFLFGSFTWTTPSWLHSLRHKMAATPNMTRNIFIGIITLLFFSYYGYHWYQSLPKPERVIAQIIPPKLTPVEHILVPNNLSIDFGVIKNGELNKRSVAPLSLIGKEVTAGITIAPAIPGRWLWDTDSHLIFTPSIDWPAGQTYTIKFARDFFSRNTKMESLKYSFTTLPFDEIITEFKFYQDPENPQLRQAIATISFSYPVDASSLENKVTLMYQALKNGKQNLAAEPVKFTMSYDEHKRTAYLHSETLPLPNVSRYLELTLAKGIKPITGHSITTESANATVLIPDAGSYFRITSASASIVRNPKDRPEQILALETTLGAKQDELTHALHVYVLPRDYPATAAEAAKPNYEWKDPGEVTTDILAASKSLELEAIPTDRDFATLHSYKFNASTPAYLYVKIDKGTHGFGDYVLANDYTTIISVPEYPHEISFMHKGALLALGTDEKLSVLVRGLDAVKFNFARILPDDINHLVTQTGGDFGNPYFIDPNFNQDNISEIFSEIRQFDASDPAAAQYTTLDLGKYLTTKTATNNPLGLFLLQARGWDKNHNVPLDAQTSRLILITDLGLIVKNNQDGTHDVFVQSITTGTPVANASIAILGKNGIPLLTRPTDAQGHVIFPTLKDFTDEREPTVYIARNGSDISFIPYNRADRELNYSRFDVGGVYHYAEQNQTALTAYLFTDRGIYRPGDTTHIGMIVKQPYVFPQPAGVPLEATLVDPRGVTVKDEKITLNDSGYLTLDFQSNATSPTGQYTVNLFIVKDNHPGNLIGATTFNVAEFLPDRMRITAQLSAQQTPGWVSPVGLTAKVGLWNLYGAPAANHRVNGKILLTPQTITFKQFPDYTFFDPLLNPKTPPKIFTDTLTPTKTDAHGQAVFDLNLDRFEKATYQLTVFTEGFESEGGRSVTTQTTALVSPLAYFVGYKPDGDLSFIKQNDVRNVNFIATNPSLKPQSLTNLKLQLFNLRPVSTLIKREDGTYQYQSIIQTTEVSSNPFVITEQGANYVLPTQQIGDFLVLIVDDKGTELSRFKYSVVGSSQLPLPKNAELNVKLSKTEFAPGEDIEMQITAPYTGAGLITIERDKVYAYQWFKTDTTASVQKIHIPTDFQGGGYVNIAFVRDLNAPEIFMSPLSYSVQPFTVTHQSHDIQVDLSTPDLARPGDAFPIIYKTDKPAKIIIFAVDEGILQVSKYQAPEPLKFFFQKQALQVNTLQIVDQILPKFIADRELSAVGGDMGAGALLKNLNPFKRKTEAPVVYWSGIVDADTTPRQLTYQIPDYFNGTLHVMAVAVAADAVGSSNKSAEVRGYFVINPNVPTFVAPSDEFAVTASVANNVQGSGANANVTIEITASAQLEIIGDTKQNVTIPEGQERPVHFKLRAKAKLGSADLKFIASMSDKSSTMSSTLSVRPASPYYTSLTSGHSTEVNKSLALDRSLYTEYRDVEATASPSPLILAIGLQNYLNQYPYGCIEQLVSKAFPLIVMSNQPWFATDMKTINDKVQQTIQIIGQRQMSSGAFNYWPEVGTTASNDFASIYAMHFLTEARALGFSVPKDVYSAGIGFLKDYAVEDVTDLNQARLHAYAIYVLTRNEIVTTNLLTNLQLALDKHTDIDWHNDITSVYIAATYQLMKSTTDAEKMIAFYKPDATQANPVEDFYNKNIANAEYLYLIAKHFPDRLPKIDSKWVTSLVAALNNDSISTILSAYTTIGLSAYAQAIPASNNSPISIVEIMIGAKQNTLSTSNDTYQKANLDDGALQVTFNNPGKQTYFYQLTQSGFDKTLSTQVIKQGIEVYREYNDVDDKPLSTVQLGDDLIVHIRIRAIDNQYHNNIAIVDLLPGGFEVARDSVKLDNVDYADVREDRIIFFSGVSPDSKEITYHIKATSTGKFMLPPIYAMAMYNPLVKSLGIAGNITVNEASVPGA